MGGNNNGEAHNSHTHEHHQVSTSTPRKRAHAEIIDLSECDDHEVFQPQLHHSCASRETKAPKNGQPVSQAEPDISHSAEPSPTHRCSLVSNDGVGAHCHTISGASSEISSCPKRRKMRFVGTVTNRECEVNQSSTSQQPFDQDLTGSYRSSTTPQSSSKSFPSREPFDLTQEDLMSNSAGLPPLPSSTHTWETDPLTTMSFASMSSPTRAFDMVCRSPSLPAPDSLHSPSKRVAFSMMAKQAPTDSNADRHLFHPHKKVDPSHTKNNAFDPIVIDSDSDDETIVRTKSMKNSVSKSKPRENSSKSSNISETKKDTRKKLTKKKPRKSSTKASAGKPIKKETKPQKKASPPRSGTDTESADSSGSDSEVSIEYLTPPLIGANYQADVTPCLRGMERDLYLQAARERDVKNNERHPQDEPAPDW